MLCPNCDVEMTIRTGVRVTGDKDPDTATRVYLVQRFFCRNPACPAFGREQASVLHEMQTETDTPGTEEPAQSAHETDKLAAT